VSVPDTKPPPPPLPPDDDTLLKPPAPPPPQARTVTDVHPGGITNGRVAPMASNVAVPGAQRTTQLPPTHCCVLEHVRPQAPQCDALVRVSTSHPLAGLPSQSAKPAEHIPTAQRPLLHVAVALVRLHAMPQAPQCVAEALRLVSQPLPGLLSQLAKPALQRMPQRPAAHTGAALLAAGHTVPQAPQWLASVAVSTQDALHTVSPAMQVSRHIPRSQSCPLGHALSQPPQWALSLWRSRQAPPHSVCPVGHTRRQLPATQLRPAPQALPQAPQWLASMRGSTQAVDIPSPHATRGAAHSRRQRPSTQPKPVGQRASQAPQWSRLTCVDTHASPHTSWPVGHTMRHTPIWHCCPAIHALPQPPQWALSLVKSRHTPLHSCCPVGHTSTHCPDRHTEPARHAVPHAPQLVLSF
jgi:hypothetical protein